MTQSMRVAAILLLAVGAGCEERVVEPVDIARVDLEPQILSVRAGTTGRFEVRLFDASGNTLPGRSIQWTLDDPDVADIAVNGTIIALSPGETEVVASAGGRQGRATLRVTSDVVAGIDVEPSDLALIFGRDATLTATIRADDGTIITDRSVVWTSAGTAIAVVDVAGTVHGVGIGSTTVRATLDGVTGEASVEVLAPDIARIDVVPASSSLEANGSVQLAAIGRLASGEPIAGLPMAWRSLNTNVAIVDGEGLVTAVGAGEARIEAGFGSVTGSASVTVAPVRAASIAVTPASVTIFVAGSTLLTADVRDADGNALERSPEWTSRSPAIATVNGSGVVTGVAAGEAWIVAALDAGIDSALVTVLPRAVERVQVQPASAHLQIDEEVTLSALVFSSDDVILERPVAWETSAAAVATVTGQGVVRAIGAGIATITATSEGVSGTASITVGPPIASILVTPNPLAIRATESGTMTARALTADGTEIPNTPFVWSSANPAVAAVVGGTVTGIVSGSTQIRASAGGVTGTATVNVAPPPVATVSVSPSSLDLDFAETGQLTATARSAAGAVIPGVSVNWTSASTAVATVSSSGVVTGRGGGTTTVTATVEGISASATVHVNPPPFDRIEVRPSSAELNVGATLTLQAVGIGPAGEVPVTASWSSSSTSIATVNGSGVVTGVAPGQAGITATLGAFQATAQIYVGRNVPTSVVIQEDDFTLEQTQTRGLHAVVRNAFGQELSTPVTWSSGASSVATVDGNGLVRAIDEGTTQITARAGSATDAVTVTVPPAPVDRVIVTPQFVVLNEGETVQLSVEIFDVFGKRVNRPVTWTSSAQGVARVDGNGLVDARKSGVAVIRATVEGKSDTATIVVEANE